MSSCWVPTLAGSYYRNPEVLERELERIFFRSWVLAGREERAAHAGDYFTFELGGESVLVVRDREGALRAFYNVCRHRGARLCADASGHLQGAIRCPYHAWSYALDGALRGVPYLRGDEAFSKEAFSLYPVAVETWQGFVFLRLEPEGEALHAQLGALPERARPFPLASLRVGAREEESVAANWKILVENFMECYHCPGVHPELVDLVPFYRTGEVDTVGSEPPAYREGACTSTRSGTTRRPIFAALRDRPLQRYHAELLLPNLLLYLFPDYVCVRALWPVSATRTRIVSEWLFEPETLARADFDPGDAVEFMNLLGGQDWRVCEAVQQGIASRAHHHGVLLPQESEVADVTRWYLERFEAE
ncbi:MAG: aromatic ring-hydroxylating dioxygenase subunit alpha [Myxococcales bacterium]|nr:aromatic ring-hydroxylating dioxygenase subunit alpha [Myxococcales bacterium]MDH5306355.1 aromatic ring-hydroxylating dioxygenase subunit alpha [Myxococcales bacterium]MDH5567002.1 aromatic ring-hydroxylating dioxygenase subunit alpha [Myxococcales bacterium]